jgi:hypothetical protein
MRLLRLTNSNDLQPGVPEAQRAPAITERIVAAATGESVEVINRVIWPGAELPDIVAGWLERFSPDVLFMRASSFWCTYESVPLRLQRRWGRLGAPLSRVGFKAGGHPTVAANPAFRRVRKLAVRTVGGETYFTPPEATRLVADVLRRVLVQEAIVPIVRGPAHAHNSSGTAAGHRRAAQANREFDALLAAMCLGCHVTYVTASGALDNPSFLANDEVHDTAAGHLAIGTLEGEAIAGAWLAARTP